MKSHLPCDMFCRKKKLKNFLACFKIQYFSQAPDRATPASRNTGCLAKGQNWGGQRGPTTSPYPGPDAGEEPQPALAPAAVPGRHQPRGTCCPLSCSSRKKGLVFHRNLPSLLSGAGDPSRSLVGLRRRGAAVPGCSGAGEPSLPPAQDVLPSPGLQQPRHDGDCTDKPLYLVSLKRNKTFFRGISSLLLQLCSDIYFAH